MTVNCPKCGRPSRTGASFCAVCGASLSITTRRLQPGQVMRSGDYRIVRPLSKGGMGVIYLAENLQAFGRLCVIKEMLDYFDPSDPRQVANARKRFEDEARTLAQLRHPGIPDIQAYFSEGGHNYIVMEYIEGMSLDEATSRLDASGRKVTGQRLPPEEIVRYGVQLCEILEYLAGRIPPVVHHDTKPANIIIEKNTGNARLVDFGTARARLTTQPGGKVGLQKSSIYGTEGYAPPEQYRGQSDPRSDVYALAATLYHLLTDDHPGDHPFRFPQLGRLPLNLGPVLAKAIESDVTRRATAAELRQGLIASLQTKTPARKASVRLPKLGPHEYYALVADQGIPDALRPTVIQYLESKLGLTAVDAEILTWQVPASIARGLEASQAASLENDLCALGVPLQRVLTSQVLGWRTGVPNLEKRLATEGEMKVSLVNIPGDRVCHCYRCENEWKTKARKLPAKCPRCASPSWSLHRLLQCSICGAQFTVGDLSKPAQTFFPECPACGIQAWHPSQQPRLRGPVLRANVGKVLIGHTTTAEITLSTSGGSPNLRGRVTPTVSWLKIGQSVLSGNRIQVLVDTTGMATKQTHVGSLDVVCNAGQGRIEVAVYVDEPPRLKVDTSSLDFGVLNAREARTLNLVLTNAGGQVLQGRVSGAPNWLRLSASNFNGDRTELRVTVRGRDLPVAGRNTATLTVDSNGGKVNVDVVATALPTTLAVEPTTLDFGYQPRDRRIRRSLILSNLGVGTLQGQFVTSAPWLIVEPSEFSGNLVRVSVTANTEKLTPTEAFDAKLTTTSNGGLAVIPVKIEVSPYHWLEHTLRLNRRLQAALLGFSLVLALVVWFGLSRPAPVSQIAWAPAGPGLLLTSGSSIYRLETSAGKRNLQLILNGLQATSVTMSADGRWAAWTDRRGNLEIWEVNQPSVRHLAFEVPIAGIRFDAAEARLAWLAGDGSFGWLDPITYEFERTGVHDGRVEHLTFSSEGGRLAVGGGAQIAVYSIADGSRLFEVPTSGRVTALALAPTGRELAWGTPRGQVFRWNPDMDEMPELQSSPTATVVAIAYDPTGRRLAWARSDRWVMVWDLDEHRLLDRGAPDGRVLSLTFSPDGERLAIGTSQGLEIRQMRQSVTRR